ncbi:Clp protease ClpP [Paraflavitalea speifideaquila]|uniref:Clp protease ClpP n=1 Tax=Paraflavitalea speifideaquila TaxID=3076558 RepID=UPI0028E30ED0|nr:Clp protease ClpP [Paraflavitalea speifideiaquila]
MNPTISFLYTVDIDADEPIMLIDKHIGFDETDGYGIMGDLFQKELLALDGMGKKRIEIWINSPGGVVADGYNIHNAMLKSKTPVDTYCTGIAASIAGVLFVAGRKRVMADYSQLMYHNPYGGDDDKGLAAIRDSIAKMVSSRCGKSVEEILSIMNKTTWIGAEEAKEIGFCDEIQHSGEINKKRSIGIINDARAFWKEAATITNSLLSPNNNSLNSQSMKKIANRLNLVSDASEDSVIEAINKMEEANNGLKAEIKTHLTDIQNRKTNMEKKEEECKALEEELEKAKNELEEMKKKKAKAKAEAEEQEEEKEKEEKAKNLINGFVTTGRIKNDPTIITSWVNKAKEDHDGVKAMIEGLPINKVAAKIEVQSTSITKREGSQVANTMAGVLKKLGGKI